MKKFRSKAFLNLNLLDSGDALKRSENGDLTIIKPDGSEETISDYSQIDQEAERLQAEYDALQYQRDRASQYPSIQDQLDMQYHDLVDGTTTWKDSIAKVKADNPKPE